MHFLLVKEMKVYFRFLILMKMDCETCNIEIVNENLVAFHTIFIVL